MSADPANGPGAAGGLADRLHSAAIRLLRTLRAEDDATGLSAPRLSALSVLVFRGPMTVGALADAEQVRPPSMSRLLTEMEAQGLVQRRPDREDARVRRVHATPAGRAILEAGRRRRVERLARAIAALGVDERGVLDRALAVLEALDLGSARTGARLRAPGAEAAPPEA